MRVIHHCQAATAGSIAPKNIAALANCLRNAKQSGTVNSSGAAADLVRYASPPQTPASNGSQRAEPSSDDALSQHKARKQQRREQQLRHQRKAEHHRHRAETGRQDQHSLLARVENPYWRSSAPTIQT